MGLAASAIEPAQPGGFRWLDARTLQFRPAEPWPALSRFRVTPVGGKPGTLATLLEAPVAAVPNDGAEGLEPFDETPFIAEALNSPGLDRIFEGSLIRAVRLVSG